MEHTITLEVYDNSTIEQIENAIENGLNNASIDCSYKVEEGNPLMKGIFVQRYKNAVNAYFNYPGRGEGKRELLYIYEEYELILKEVFSIKDEDIREMFRELYLEHYTEG